LLIGDQILELFGHPEAEIKEGFHINAYLTQALMVAQDQFDLWKGLFTHRDGLLTENLAGPCDLGEQWNPFPLLLDDPVLQVRKSLFS